MLKKSFFLRLLPIVPAVGYGFCNYQLDTKFRGTDKFSMMLTYCFMGVLGSLAGMYLRDGTLYSQKLLSFDRIVDFAVFGMIWYISDYTYFTVVEEGYSIISTSMSLALIPVVVVIIKVVLDRRLPLPSELAVCILVVVIALILGTEDSFNNSVYSFLKIKK